MRDKRELRRVVYMRWRVGIAESASASRRAQKKMARTLFLIGGPTLEKAVTHYWADETRVKKTARVTRLGVAADLRERRERHVLARVLGHERVARIPGGGGAFLVLFTCSCIV